MESRIHIANLDPTITQDHILGLFLPFGPVIEVLLPIDNKSKTLSRGFADVQFENEVDALAAIDNMDGAEVYGKVLQVRKSIKEGPKLDNKKPVWEQSEVMENTTTRTENPNQLE